MQRRNFSSLRFEVSDAAALPFCEEFDAVLSNAALHWMSDQRGAIASVARALREGGRFVFEMGGHGNLHQVLEAAFAALNSLGVQAPQSLVPWYFPSVAEYRCPARVTRTGGAFRGLVRPSHGAGGRRARIRRLDPDVRQLRFVRRAARAAGRGEPALAGSRAGETVPQRGMDA